MSAVPAVVLRFLHRREVAIVYAALVAVLMAVGVQPDASALKVAELVIGVLLGSPLPRPALPFEPTPAALPVVPPPVAEAPAPAPALAPEAPKPEPPAPAA